MSHLPPHQARLPLLRFLRPLHRMPSPLNRKIVRATRPVPVLPLIPSLRLFRKSFLWIVATSCLAFPHSFLAQAALPASDPAGNHPHALANRVPAAYRVESDLITEAFVSYGHYRIFASGADYHLFGSGFEYDRNSWGRLFGARLDYSAEFLPVLLLNTADTTDIWGSSTSPHRKIVPGMGISPIGFRLVWLDRRKVKPYLSAKGGMTGFTQKVLSQKATYEDFSFQSGGGLLVRMNRQLDLRLGFFNDFHFSNGFITPVNPGLDVMNANIGISYRIGSRRHKAQ